MSFVVASLKPPLWKTLKDQGVRRAQDVLDELGIYKAPVNLDFVCAALGVELVRVESASWSGALKSSAEPPRAICYVDGSEPRTRQRFSIAHELGHLFLDKTGLMFRDAFGPSDSPREHAANAFAAELLMPEHNVLGIAADHRYDAAALARVFDVSADAMGWRLQNLGIDFR